LRVISQIERNHQNLFNPKEVVTVQELAVSNMLELETLRQLLFEKGVITQDEFIAKFKKLDREMKEKRGR
jgi:hypothetical protein